MTDTVYRCIAFEMNGTLKERIVTSEAKAIETCERWGRVPTFTRVGYMPSRPVEWDISLTTLTKKAAS